MDEACRCLIYEHFDSIAKAHKEISRLTEVIEESNENNYIQSFPSEERYYLRKRDEESYK